MSDYGQKTKGYGKGENKALHNSDPSIVEELGETGNYTVGPLQVTSRHTTDLIRVSLLNKHGLIPILLDQCSLDREGRGSFG